MCFCFWPGRFDDFFSLSLNGIRLDNIEFVISRSETYYSIGKFKIQGHKVTGGLQIKLEFHFLLKLGDVDEINLGQGILGIFFLNKEKKCLYTLQFTIM